MSRHNEVTEARSRLGFPEGTHFRALAASETGACLIVTISLTADPRGSSRLFVRGFEEARYREVAAPAGCNSLERMVLAHAPPAIFALGYDWTATGGNVHGLYRVDLPGNRADLIHSARSSDAGSSDGGTWWISNLLDVSPDGQRLIITRAVEKPHAEGRKVEYSVCSFVPADGAIVTLASLPAVFA